MRTSHYRVLSYATAAVTLVAAVLAVLLVTGFRTPATGAVLTASLVLLALWCVARARPRRP